MVSFALAGCGRKDVVIPNVTHINGIPIEQYDPNQFDPTQDNVFGVAPTAAASAPGTAAVTTATAAQAAAPVPQAAAEPEPEPQPEPEPEPEPQTGGSAPSSDGSISGSTLVDGQPVAVSVLDPAATAALASQAGIPTSSALGLAEADSAIRITGIGGKDIVKAIRGYSRVCDVGFEQVIDWINKGGRVTEVSQSFDYLFWTDVCPRLAKYRRQ